MIPPQLHISFEELLSAGLLAIITVGAPGTQGALVTGMQGIGVSTPSAAAVAAATVGFAIDWHMPNGMTFFIGILSMIVANGIVETTLFSGVTIKADGAIPKEHWHIAPPHTPNPILYSSLIPLYCPALMYYFSPAVLFWS
jgi:hypothetical protein